MRKQKSDPHTLRVYNRYLAGLIAVILVAFQALSGLTLDVWMIVALTAFAAALPLLAGALVVNIVEERYPYGTPRSKHARAMNLFTVLGVVATLVGLDALFWHFFWLPGVVFPTMLLVSILVYGWYISDLDVK